MRVARDFDRNHYSNAAAALAFFLMLSLFPLLIFLSSLLSYIWTPAAFEQAIHAMSGVVPQSTLNVILSVLDDVLRTNFQLVSFGMLGALFAASGGFNALIGALNLAYDVPEGRPYWKKRLIALELTVMVGALTLAALSAMILGPHFGIWLNRWTSANSYLTTAWPYLRWTGTIVFAVFSVELVYFLAPNVNQRFRAQVPGAAVAVAAWVLSSYGLSWYLHDISNMNRIYGALGAPVALMLWLYVGALAILIGAELNSELTRSSGAKLQQKEHAVDAA